MPLSGPAYDPDILAMLYRALDAAVRQAIPDIDALNEASLQYIREELARALIRAYEDGERDPELLSTIAVQSYRRTKNFPGTRCRSARSPSGRSRES